VLCARAQNTAKEQYEREQRFKPSSSSSASSKARSSAHNTHAAHDEANTLACARSQAPQPDGPGDPLLRDGKQKGFGRKK
jgi:hypothetical protein